MISVHTRTEGITQASKEAGLNIGDQKQKKSGPIHIRSGATSPHPNFIGQLADPSALLNAEI